MQHRQALNTKYEGTEDQTSTEISEIATVNITAVVQRVYPCLEAEFFFLMEKKIRYPSEGDIIFPLRRMNLIFGSS